MECVIGRKAPSFTCVDDREQIVRSDDLLGHPWVLYFYPKDNTSGCTRQACDFRRRIDDFTRQAVRVIGVSKDSIASHRRFRERYQLPFTLLSDADTRVCQSYGVWVEKSMYGRRYMGIERSTFLVDGKGILINAWRKVKVPGHVDAVVGCLADL